MKKSKAKKTAASRVNPNTYQKVDAKTKKLVGMAMKQYTSEYGRAMSKLAKE